MKKQNVVYTYNELHGHRKDKILIHVATLRTLSETLRTLSRISPLQKDKYFMIPFT